jgi:hypothetical protein
MPVSRRIGGEELLLYQMVKMNSVSGRGVMDFLKENGRN